MRTTPRRLAPTAFWLLTLCLGPGLLLTHLRPPTARPLQFACWYWHRPFHLTAGERRQLAAARIERLYVYAGTVAAHDGELRLTRVQQWSSPSPCELYPVLRVHPSANALLLSRGGAAWAAEQIRRITRLRDARGIQWDADIPTSRLRGYVRFLDAVRQRIRPVQRLSVTALPDWLHSTDYERLAGTLDEIAPQFYGNYWPEPRRRPPALWETRHLMEAVRRSACGRAQVWVGLPAYGRCVVMDAAGQPIGVRHDLDPDRLLEDPAWEVQSADTRIEPIQETATPVEDTLALRSREASTAGPMEAPRGTQLWFQWPRVDGLRRTVVELLESAPVGVEGVCFFRWPEPGEPLSLPSTAMAAATAALDRGGRGVPALRLRLARHDSMVQITALNDGLDSPSLSGQISVEVTPPPGAEVSADGPVVWQSANARASAIRGDRAIFSRPLLRPASHWEVCRVERALGPVRARIRWRGPTGAWEGRSFVEQSPGVGRLEARAGGLP